MGGREASNCGKTPSSNSPPPTHSTARDFLVSETEPLPSCKGRHQWREGRRAQKIPSSSSCQNS